MSSPRRKKPADRYHHGDLRNALITQAWAIIDQRGQAALSMRAVAEALGVSHAAPAHHFADKEALLQALRRQAWSDFADALESAGDAPDALRHMGRTHVAYALAHPRRIKLIFRSNSASSPEVESQSMRALRRSEFFLRPLGSRLGHHIGGGRDGDARATGAGHFSTDLASNTPNLLCDDRRTQHGSRDDRGDD